MISEFTEFVADYFKHQQIVQFLPKWRATTLVPAKKTHHYYRTHSTLSCRNSISMAAFKTAITRRHVALFGQNHLVYVGPAHHSTALFITKFQMYNLASTVVHNKLLLVKGSEESMSRSKKRSAHES